jgi:hypothetical protein
MDVSDDDGDDHGDGDYSGDDPDVSEGIPVETPSTSVANRTQSALVGEVGSG